MPIANGLAWAAQLEGKQRVAVATFGDGASNIGAFHESLNLASVWDLPVIFVCQNNLYAEHTKFATATACMHVADRADAYSMPGIRVNGNDPFEMYAAARTAIERARRGEGPTLIEAVTFRFFGHILGDNDSYIDKAEKDAAISADPYPAFRATLIAKEIATEPELAKIETDAEIAIDDAIEFALASPYPTPRELGLDVYAKEAAL
jgi:pyruvate dehydrogenase E1 component alpha subunit